MILTINYQSIAKQSIEHTFVVSDLVNNNSVNGSTVLLDALSSVTFT